MKRIILSSSLIFMPTMSSNVNAANGKVAFTGEIIQSACQVVSGDRDKQVFLGKYATSAFPTIGSTSGAKAFSISLEKCDAGNYTLRFDGPTPEGQPNLLAVSKAVGVGIELLANNDKPFPIGQVTGDDAQYQSVASSSDASGTTTFNLRARYKSYQQNVVAGEANANATFTVEYK